MATAKSRAKQIKDQLDAFRSVLDGYQPTNNFGAPTLDDQVAAKAAEVMAENIEHILFGELADAGRILLEGER